MGEQWHLVRGGRQSGPHSFEEVKNLLAGVDPAQEQVLVWTERLTEWTDPRSVAGLLETAPTVKAPPTAGQVAFPVSASASPRPDWSSLNPYETPASALIRPSPSSTGEMGNHKLSVGSCLEAGWKLTTSQFGKIILFGLAYVGILIALMAPLAVLDAIFGLKQSASDTTNAAVLPSVNQALVTLVCQILQNVISVFLGIGGMLFGLGMVRRTNPSMGVMFAGGPHFWSVLLASILVGICVLAGFILLIVPGFFLLARLSQFQFAIIDQKLGPLDGIKASWVMTKGNFWNIVLLGLASMGIVLLGGLALGVGLLWAYPTVLLAAAAAYVCMSQGVGALPKVE